MYNHNSNDKEQELSLDADFLKKEIAPLIKNLPEKNQKALLVKLSTATSMHSGPLPPPKQLQEYGELIPNGAERIMTMAEKQQEHRITFESDGMKRSYKLANRGQLFGFILGTLGLLIALACIIFGHLELAEILFKYTIVSLSSIFVIGKLSNR